MPRRGALALAALVPLLALSACQTGKRPSFSTDPFVAGAMTGDANVDAVLTRLDAATKGPATAAYTVLRKYGVQDFTAVVVLDQGRRSVTLGNIRFVETGGTSETCHLDGSAPCVDGLQEQAASDTGLTIDFYAADMAKRLRRKTQALVGPSVAHDETVAGQHASCVDLPLNGGTAQYCVLDNGLVAHVDDSDVAVTLTSYSDTVDEGAFATSG